MSDATPNDAADAAPDDLRLGPVSYVILGFVSHAGPITSYEIKQKVERSVGYVWPFPHTQLYTEPKRLEALGLVQSQEETDGRRRRSYTATDAGRDALRAWLDTPADTHMEIRDLGLLQLFFGGMTDDAPDVTAERVRALAHAQRAAHEQRMAAYRAIEQSITCGETSGPVLDSGCSHRTLQIGMQMERLMIDFWQQVADDPPDHC